MHTCSSFRRESKTLPIRPLVAMDSMVQPPQLPQNYSFYSFQIAGHHYSKQKDENFAFKFLELENLTCPFNKPCVIDVKLGARTWDPLAPRDKIAYEKSKYPHAQTLGFRFLGTMVYKENTDDYEHHDKEWGKMLTENDVLPALQSYFPKELRPCKILAACILRKLHNILHFFSHQRLLTFYSSSILISYEGANLIAEIDNMLTSIIATNLKNYATKMDSDNQKLDDDDSLLRKFDALNCIPTTSTPNLDEKEEILYRKFDTLFSVKMIDFTHVFEHTDSDDDDDEENQQSATALDENYLHGLKNLIKYLTIFSDSLVF